MPFSADDGLDHVANLIAYGKYEQWGNSLHVLNDDRLGPDVFHVENWGAVRAGCKIRSGLLPPHGVVDGAPDSAYRVFR